ncbi:MAG: hypothetical protein V1934_06890 [Methanobacteriota archaeon]
MPKKRGRPRKTPVADAKDEPEELPAPLISQSEDDVIGAPTDKPSMTSIQLTPAVRDRLWRLKFRKTYDAFLAELCEMYEAAHREE